MLIALLTIPGLSARCGSGFGSGFGFGLLGGALLSSAYNNYPAYGYPAYPAYAYAPQYNFYGPGYNPAAYNPYW